MQITWMEFKDKWNVDVNFIRETGTQIYGVIEYFQIGSRPATNLEVLYYSVDLSACFTDEINIHIPFVLKFHPSYLHSIKIKM